MYVQFSICAHGDGNFMKLLNHSVLKTILIKWWLCTFLVIELLVFQNVLKHNLTAEVSKFFRGTFFSTFMQKIFGLKVFVIYLTSRGRDNIKSFSGITMPGSSKTRRKPNSWIIKIKLLFEEAAMSAENLLSWCS